MKKNKNVQKLVIFVILTLAVLHNMQVGIVFLRS